MKKMTELTVQPILQRLSACLLALLLLLCPWGAAAYGEPEPQPEENAGEISVYPPADQPATEDQPEENTGEISAYPPADQPTAEDQPAPTDQPELQTEPQPEPVTDAAGLLTEEQIEELAGQARELSSSYDCGIYIVTVDDFRQLDSSGLPPESIEEAAENVYLQDLELGLGPEHSGILLMLSMAERDYCLYAFGYGNEAFTDWGKDCLAQAFLDDFAEDDWYSGFSDYVRYSGEMLESARQGNTLDNYGEDYAEPWAPDDGADASTTGRDRAYGITVCVLLSLLIAMAVRNFLLRQLKSVEAGTEAAAFIEPSGLKLTKKYDRYTHTTRTKVYDPPKKSSSSGSRGGGTTVNSRGGSSKSGKF